MSEPGATISNASQVAAAAAEQGLKDRLKQIAGHILNDDAAKLGIVSTTTAATNLVSVHLLFFSLFLLFKSVFCCCLSLSLSLSLSLHLLM